MLKHIQKLLIIIFVINVIGYVLSVLKEKIYLKNNIIVINKKSVTQKHLEKADMKEFILDGARVKSGDEVRIITVAKEKIDGIMIGAIKKERSILMVTHDDEIKKLNIDNILKFKIISKYGKFFKI
ncbi:hypothetical protein EDD65_10554 [Keratinibaculum paraultunense]|uniref:Uncharacterized protein n=1 Tax=Keratinibaculum paraultunense TaxID=1278232 RepID=A0A4R3KVC8_9FIRM|nr:hypothetical protein [Keratinibaculum paraultunense]QQY78740.1 hypothetical protein JL105_05800 [Keratinibaculum paraultunense]TCS89581.1 hypothetical protein EDD65_10554 [Keratinibaculum paraultunense]